MSRPRPGLERANTLSCGVLDHLDLFELEVGDGVALRVLDDELESHDHRGRGRRRAVPDLREAAAAREGQCESEGERQSVPGIRHRLLPQWPSALAQASA